MRHIWDFLYICLSSSDTSTKLPKQVFISICFSPPYNPVPHSFVYRKNKVTSSIFFHVFSAAVVIFRKKNQPLTTKITCPFYSLSCHTSSHLPINQFPSFVIPSFSLTDRERTNSAFIFKVQGGE